MGTKDPIEKAKEDLERIVRDSNRTIKRAERAIRNISKRDVNPQIERLSLNEKINYRVLDKILKNYVGSKEVPGVRNHIRELLREGEITTNMELLSGYNKLDISDKKKLGKVEIKALAFYICYINH